MSRSATPVDTPRTPRTPRTPHTAPPTDRQPRSVGRRRWRTTISGAGAAALLVLAACGSDNTTKSTTVATTASTSATTAAGTTAVATTAVTTTRPATTQTATPTTAAPTTAGSTAPSVAATSTTRSSGATFDQAGYCAAELTLETTANGLDPSNDPKGFADQLLAVVQPAAALAPTELQASFATAIATLQSVSSSGDPSALENLGTPPDVHAFDLKTCGWHRVDVTAKDYMFDGLPTTLAAGPTDFELTNTGLEFHVLVILKKKAGVTESFDELLADPDAESKTDTVVGVAAAAGAPAGSGIVDLAPGEYLAICPIATGSTGGNEGTGAPHFTLGMHQAITVT